MYNIEFKCQYLIPFFYLNYKGLSTKECKCGKCCKGPDGEATDDLCPDGYECSKNPKFICYGSCLKVDSKAKSRMISSFIACS